MAAYSFASPFVIDKRWPFTTGVGIAGAAITQCQALYIDTEHQNVLKLAQSNGTLLQATVAGISLHSAAIGQPIQYAVTGVPNWDSGDQFTPIYLADTPGVLDTAPGSGFWVLVGYVGNSGPPPMADDRPSAIQIVCGAVQI